MDRMDYVQAVIRTRVLEKKLLPKEKFVQMAEADNMDELRKILESTPYAIALGKITHMHEFEKMLLEELQQVYQTMREISPQPDLINLLTLKYDYHHLKVLCKEKILNTDLSHLYLPFSTNPVEKLTEESATRTKMEQVLKDYDEYGDAQRMDILFDRFYMKDVYDAVVTLDTPLFSEYVKAKIDFLNIRTLIRLQKQKKGLSLLREVLLENGNINLETILYSLHDSVQTMMRTFRKEEISASVLRGLEAYEETKRLTDFEKEMDDYLMEILQKAKHIHFGPEPLIAYILAKETEINNLRMLIISKQNDIATERILQRVREVYV